LKGITPVHPKGCTPIASKIDPLKAGLRLSRAAAAVEETLAYYTFPEEHWRRIQQSARAHPARDLRALNTIYRAFCLVIARHVRYALPLVIGTAQRYRLGAAFSSPSPIVLITVLYFSAIAIFQALVERFAFLDYANSLQDVGYLFGLNNDCLALCLASPSNVSQFVLGKPFANVTLSEICFPLFTVGVHFPCCQEQRSDTR
jgi:hypothetical protein